MNVSFVIDTNLARSANPDVQIVEQVRQSLTTVPGLSEYISAFEIGNEPDLFGGHNDFRNASYDFADYFSEFSANVDALKKVVNRSRFIQAATFASDHWCAHQNADQLTQYLDAYADTFTTFSWHK